jgi:hypothetical protein
VSFPIVAIVLHHLSVARFRISQKPGGHISTNPQYCSTVCDHYGTVFRTIVNDALL